MVNRAWAVVHIRHDSFTREGGTQRWLADRLVVSLMSALGRKRTLVFPLYPVRPPPVDVYGQPEKHAENYKRKSVGGLQNAPKIAAEEYDSCRDVDRDPHLTVANHESQNARRG